MATDCLSFFSIATVFTLAIAAAPAWAQQRDFTVPSGSLHSLQPEMIRQNDPGFLVRADVNRASRSYRDGDTLSITVASEADAYLYVLYKQADGKVFQIFPNSVQSQNRVRARQAVQIPDSDDTFRWVIGPPFGTEYVKVIASKEPLEGMSDPAMRAKFFNPVSGRNIKGIELELGKKKMAWAEDCCEITTYAADSSVADSGARRYGLFIGLGEYEYLRPVADVVSEGKTQRVLASYPGHRDARLLGGVLREVGHLDGSKILTNDLAARSKIEEAITRWLPSVAHPGDTAIIYFSGIAVAVPKTHGGADKEPQVALACYEQLYLAHVRALAKQYQDGKLDSEGQQLLQKALQIMGSATTDEERQAALARGFGISNDLLVHWLQALAGRQIILILDAPYSSAFSPKQVAVGALRLGAGWPVALPD